MSKFTLLFYIHNVKLKGSWIYLITLGIFKPSDKKCKTMNKHIKNNVYWVGKTDWELRKFHGNEYSTNCGMEHV